jgi:hypothetical protein
MTKNDLFRIILKLMGLYFLIGLLTQLPNLVFYMIYEESNEFYWLFLLAPILSIVSITLLLARPILVIRLFGLDKGFDNEVVSNSFFDGKGIIRLSFVIISIYLIAINLSDFISQLVYSFKKSVQKNSLDNLIGSFDPFPVNYQIMINSGLCILIGFLILTNNSRLASWIDRLNKKNV